MGAVVRKSAGEWIFDVLNVLFMFLMVVVTIYPFLNMLSVSVSEDGPILRGEVSFYPRGFDLAAYEEVFTTSSLWRAYGNTIFVAVTGCTLSVVLTSFAAYPLAYCSFRGKKLLNVMIMLTMWFHAGMIPTFLVVRSLGLIDSLWALITVPLIGAFNVIILTTFMRSVPASMVESARMDGSNDFRTLFQIVYPLSKAALATISLWIAVGHWNDFFAPLIYLNDHRKYTLQIVLRDIVLLNSGLLYGFELPGNEVAALSEQIKNAVIFVSIVPIIAAYPFLQKHFVRGVMLGAVKG